METQNILGPENMSRERNVIKLVKPPSKTEFENANVPNSSMIFLHTFQVIYHNRKLISDCWIEEEDGRVTG